MSRPPAPRGVASSRLRVEVGPLEGSWAGTVLAAPVDGLLERVWSCAHRHRSDLSAFRCALRERDRRVARFELRSWG